MIDLGPVINFWFTTEKVSATNDNNTHWPMNVRYKLGRLVKTSVNVWVSEQAQKLFAITMPGLDIRKLEGRTIISIFHSPLRGV